MLATSTQLESPLDFFGIYTPEPNARREVYRMQSHDFGVIRFAPKRSQLASEQQNLAFVECHFNIPYPSLLLHSLNTHISVRTSSDGRHAAAISGTERDFLLQVNFGHGYGGRSVVTFPVPTPCLLWWPF